MADYTDAVDALVPNSRILWGTATATDSTTPVTLITIPAGRVFKGQLNVTATSRATTAAYGTASLRMTGTGAFPTSGTNFMTIGSSRDASSVPLTFDVQLTAGSVDTTVQLVNSTVTTFNSSASAFGELI